MSDTFVTPWAVACQPPLSMGFPRQEYWSGLPFPSPGGLPHPKIERVSPALAGGFFTTEPAGSPDSCSQVFYFVNHGASDFLKLFLCLREFVCFIFHIAHLSEKHSACLSTNIQIQQSCTQ